MAWRSDPVLRFIVVVESYERIAAQTHTFPSEEQCKKIIGKYDELHISNKENHEEPVTSEPLFMFHVIETVYHDEEADPSNDV